MDMTNFLKNGSIERDTLGLRRQNLSFRDALYCVPVDAKEYRTGETCALA